MGFIGSEGDLKAGLIGAISFGALSKINSLKYFTPAVKEGVTQALSNTAQTLKSLAHGVVRGVSSVTNGGKFQHGFAGSIGSDYAAELGIENIESATGKIVAEAAAGGGVAELGGGKFANGARTGAFLQATTEAADYYRNNIGGRATLNRGKIMSELDDVDENGQQLAQYRDKLVLGLKRELGSDPGLKGFLLDLGTENGFISRALNLVPGLNSALARVHDYWFNEKTGYKLNVFNNYPTFIPAAAVGYTATIGEYTYGWQNNSGARYAISQTTRDND
ncbi:MAG: hypothetical protein QNK15_11205 [Cycloclasticus sp.]|nr:hypothetical protein [Cycloclasticus sp.]